MGSSSKQSKWAALRPCDMMYSRLSRIQQSSKATMMNWQCRRGKAGSRQAASALKTPARASYGLIRGLHCLSSNLAQAIFSDLSSTCHERG